MKSIFKMVSPLKFLYSSNSALIAFGNLFLKNIFSEHEPQIDLFQFF